MTWTRLDDGFADHPKVEAISNDAFALHVITLVDCNRRGTDGVITRKHLLVLQTERGVGDDAVKELVDVGLWEQNGSKAFRVHDFLKYNPSHKQEERRKAVHAKVMRELRARKRDA